MPLNIHEIAYFGSQLKQISHWVPQDPPGPELLQHPHAVYGVYALENP